MEIEKERDEQMKKLAKKREEEERELELKRKAEWARKRRVELEGQRDWEKKHLYSLRVQHSQLEDELRQLDQKKLGVLASIERQKGSQTQMSMSLRSMRVSHDIRRAEITKLQTELNVRSRVWYRLHGYGMVGSGTDGMVMAWWGLVQMAWLWHGGVWYRWHGYGMVGSGTDGMVMAWWGLVQMAV